jgi:hypothetical protein
MAAPVSRFLIFSAWCAGLFALSPSRPAAAQDASSEVYVADLVCPHTLPAAPPKPPVVHHTGGTVSMTGTQMPSDAELGELARTVIRDQPPLDPQAIPGLSIDGAALPRRIAFWGDSHIAAGPFMPTLIDALRARGLSVAPHFLPPTMGRANVVLPGLRAHCIGSGWSTDIAYTASATVEIGPSLVNRVADGGPESYLWLDLRDASRQARVRRLQLVYRAPAGATIEYRLDDGSAHPASLAGTSDSHVLSVEGERPISTIKLQVTRGKLELYGIMLDYEQPPAVSFDVFGLPSATVRGWANADPAFLARALHGTSYDGVVLEYGTNEGAASDFDPDKYAAMLGKALGNLRQVLPTASCVLVGPPDRGVLRAGRGAPLPLLAFGRVHQQIESIQRQVGSRYGCVSWSWQDLMGGPGGSYGWARAQPSMMGHDLIHLSPDGYRRTGRALARSLGWSP